MNNEVYEIGQKLYTVDHGRLDIPTDLVESLGIEEGDLDLYGPVIEEQEVRSVTIKVSQTTAHDGSMTRREERWHRLSSGSLIGPGNLIKMSFLTLEEATAKAQECYLEELEDAKKELSISQARIAFYEQRLNEGPNMVRHDEPEDPNHEG
jgi:hypothetical protein